MLGVVLDDRREILRAIRGQAADACFGSLKWSVRRFGCFGLSAVNDEQIIAARPTTIVHKAVIIADSKIHGVFFD